MSYKNKINFDLHFDTNNLGNNYLRNKNINYIKNDNCIGRTIQNGIYWELWMLKYIQENYIQNTNIIDLGGNIGTTTLLMSEVLSDNSNIYTFEPMYSDILLKNILDNNLLNKVKLYPYGVGNKLEVLKIKNFDYNLTNNFGAFSIIENVDNSFESLEIHITPLDIYNFENVSLIKIDVENMEIEVLEGAINLLKRCKPTIIIETHQFDKFVESNIFKELLELGYLINRIPEGCNDFIMKINTN